MQNVAANNLNRPRQVPATTLEELLATAWNRASYPTGGRSGAVPAGRRDR